MSDIKKDWKHRRGYRGRHSGNENTGSQDRHSPHGGERSGQAGRSGGVKRTRENSDSNSHNQQRPHASQYRHSRGHGGSAQLTPSTVHSTSPTAAPGSSATLSEPVAREIPGFYFDPEKKKYFKITANHVLGSQHPFSRQSIKEKTEQKPVVEALKKRVGRRFPSAITHYGRLDWFLQDCQLGLAGSPRRQLCEVHALLVKGWTKSKRTESLLADHGTKYTHLRVDSTRQDLYLATSDGRLSRYRVSGSPSNQGQWTSFDIWADMTSVHITPDEYLITTHLGDMRQSGTLKVQKRADSGEFFSPVFQYLPKKSNIWTSDLTPSRMVVGADQRVILIQNWKSESRVIRSLWTGSDVFSVAIDPPGMGDVIYAGCRNGAVRVFDLNRPGIFEQYSEAGHHKKERAKLLFSGIGHKESSVHCMKRVSGHYLVTAAMNGEISMWDTRFIAKKFVSDPSSFAKPVLDIRGPIHNHFAKTPFAINREETLLASENLPGRLSLWSLSAGDRIQDFDVGGSVASLEFSTEQGIWAAVENQVQYWGMDGV